VRQGKKRQMGANFMLATFHYHSFIYVKEMDVNQINKIVKNIE